MASFYTNGGEFTLENGEIYIGYYHLMDLGRYMTGIQHSTMSERLIAIEGVGIETGIINLETTKIGKEQYKKRINTEFTELINTTEENNIFNALAEESTLNITTFFDLYNKFFYDIPKTGQINSHETLIKQSTEYIDFNPNEDLINSLQDEITSLREELLEEQQKNADLLNSLNN